MTFAKEEWGPWTSHDGSGCPFPAGTIVEVLFEDAFGYRSRTVATVTGGSYSSWNWETYPELKRIIRYREKRPRGMQILDAVLKDVDAPVTDKTKLPDLTDA